MVIKINTFNWKRFGSTPSIASADAIFPKCEKKIENFLSHCRHISYEKCEIIIRILVNIYKQFFYFAFIAHFV